jgi:lipoprotein signal peptidase
MVSVLFNVTAISSMVLQLAFSYISGGPGHWTLINVAAVCMGMVVMIQYQKSEIKMVVIENRKAILSILAGVLFMTAVFGVRANGTIWLNICRYLPVPIEAVIYVFVPLAAFSLFDDLGRYRLNRLVTIMYKVGIFAMYALFVCYQYSLIMMAKGSETGLGYFGRLSPMIAVCMVAGIMLDDMAYGMEILG